MPDAPRLSSLLLSASLGGLLLLTVVTLAGQRAPALPPQPPAPPLPARRPRRPAPRPAPVRPAPRSPSPVPAASPQPLAPELSPGAIVVPPASGDCAPAINEALRAAVAAGGGTVYLPAGRYELGAPLVIETAIGGDDRQEVPFHVRLRGAAPVGSYAEAKTMAMMQSSSGITGWRKLPRLLEAVKKRELQATEVRVRVRFCAFLWAAAHGSRRALTPVGEAPSWLRPESLRRPRLAQAQSRSGRVEERCHKAVQVLLRAGVQARG